MFVLKSSVYGFGSWDGFYTGDEYRYQGERYAVSDTSLEAAKKYKTRRLAERVCENLNRRICNYNFTVVEVIQKQDASYEVTI